MLSINPNDYNIDNFNSQSLGPISVENFRDYILNYNLEGVNPEVLNSGFNNNTLNIFVPLLFNSNTKVVDVPNLSEVSFVPSLYNNNTSPRPDNKEKNIYKNDDPFFGPATNEETFLVDGTKSLTSPGSIDSWLVEGGFSTDVFTIRNFVHLSNNEYGPTEIFDYSGINQTIDNTGFKSYSSINPVQSDNIISQVVLRTLGFSPTNFVNFPSQLEDIAKERRLFEIQSRIKINLTTDTIGLLNLNTTQLLLGNGLITPDYVITRPPGLFSRVANFTASLAGFNVPVSILPGTPNTRISSNFFQEELVRFTGRAQKNLIYFNAYSSKYSSPLLSKSINEGEGGILQNIKNFFKDLGREQTSNYLTIAENNPEEKTTLAQKIGKFFNDLISPETDPQLIPTNEVSVNPQDPFVTMGVDGEYPSIESMDQNSLFNNEELNQPQNESLLSLIGLTESNPKYNNTTLRPTLSDYIFEINNPHKSSTFTNFDWRSRQQPIAKRGLLKYTQDMINSAKTNNNRGAARFIGRFDDDSNIINQNGIPRHSNVSKGNLVKNSDNTAYCRSWSTRNPYQNHYDLIRNDRLYKLRNKTEYLSVLEDTGHVKITPYSSDGNIVGSDSVQAKRYMFSIENLAWLDADEKLALPNCEIGPNGGRIMWFPPYEISFTDNTTANWETTNFLGRSEPIYTYNSTERKGTLSFKVITDHPSVLQEMKRKTEEEIYRFFAGCGLDIDDLFPKTIIEEVIEEVIEIEEVKATTEEEIINEPTLGDEQTPVPPPPIITPPDNFKVYFENARNDKFEGGVRKGIGRDIEEELNRGYEINGLNQDVTIKLDELAEFLATKEGQNWGVEFIGYTSAAAPNDYNKILSIDRATSVHNFVVNKLKPLADNDPTNYVFNKENIKSASSGFVCKSGVNCLTETSNNRCFRVNSPELCYPKLNIEYLQPVSGDFEKSTQGRFLIVAKGEDFAKSKENENPNNKLPKSERYVQIKLFKNEVWTLENTTPKQPENDDKTPPLVPIRSLEPQTTFDVDESIIGKTYSFTPKTGGGGPYNGTVVVVGPNRIGVSLELPPAIGLLLPPDKVYENGFVDVDLTLQDGVWKNNMEFNDFFGGGLISNEIVPPPPQLSPEQFLETFNLAKNIQEQKELRNKNPRRRRIEDEKKNVDVGETENDEVNDSVTRRVIQRTVEKLFTECDYFEKIKTTDPFIYDKITEKIKYFHPSFHSTSPEGFNSRLNFLHQCMRQGPNVREEGVNVRNMAFGRPPVCILRLGDFYYTRIIIDSLNIQYEPLVWDMNPEGIGVQPMIASVDLNFSIIGGSSLSGPITQLQNAVSFNYFANTSVYNPARIVNTQLGGFYKTLEERLSENAENLELNENEVVFGSYESEESAIQFRKFTKVRKNVVTNSDSDQILDIPITTTTPRIEIGDLEQEIIEDNFDLSNGII